MTKQTLWELIEAYRMSGGSEEHHARKEQLDAVLDGLLAQPEQEPVAWRKLSNGEYGFCDDMTDFPTHEDFGWEPLYITPPQRTWVGLTADELNMIGDRMRTWNSHSLADVYVAIEAKLKEKNT